MPEFLAEFKWAWSNLSRSCLKLECWQVYREQESNRSLDIYMGGDIETATALLREEAESSRSLYESIKLKGLDFARIRLVKLPMTAYLEYEMINYEIRESMGENIEIVVLDSRVSVPGNDFFDFLVFDEDVALIHDYGMDGFQVGGWLVDESEVVRRLRDIAATLRGKSIPLMEFLRTANV